MAHRYAAERQVRAAVLGRRRPPVAAAPVLGPRPTRASSPKAADPPAEINYTGWIDWAARTWEKSRSKLFREARVAATLAGGTGTRVLHALHCLSRALGIVAWQQCSCVPSCPPRSFFAPPAPVPLCYVCQRVGRRASGSSAKANIALFVLAAVRRHHHHDVRCDGVLTLVAAATSPTPLSVNAAPTRAVPACPL